MDKLTTGDVLITEKSSSMDDVLTMPEAAKILRISAPQAYKLARRGEIPCFRVGNQPRVRRSDLLAWIERRVAVTTQ